MLPPKTETRFGAYACESRTDEVKIVSEFQKTQIAREMFDWAQVHADRAGSAALVNNMTDHELALVAAQGFARLWRDINSPETLLDVAARRIEREEVDAIIEGESLPGWERPRDEWAEAARRGYTDVDAI